MKIRWTNRSVRLRLDDLEVAALLSGKVLEARLDWLGGGWGVLLDPHHSGVAGEGGLLRIGLAAEISALADPQIGGVRLDGPLRVDVEKDYHPAHLN